MVVANGVKLPIFNIGNCLLYTSTKPLELNPIFHIRQLKDNVISICHLCKDDICQVVVREVALKGS